MIARSSLTRTASTLLFTIAAFGHAFADSTSATRAARLTLAQGTVTVTEANNSASVPAQANLPLLTGVQIATGDDGQAEIEFEDGSVVRLTPNTALSLDNLAIGSDGVFVTDLSLLHGLAYCELRATPQYSFMLNAGGDILSPVENTTVRIAFDQPPATFSVLEGTAEIDRQAQAAAGYQTQVHTGETLQADPADPSRYFLTQDIAADSWDQWNESLDQQASTQSTGTTAVRDTYAGADGYGWSDLDANGSWYDVPGEGPVWQPQVADIDSGFDPYGNGAWVYYPATGYIWASGYSWGWTPYRCGSWSYYNGFGWGWAPGSGCGGHGWGFGGADSTVNINRIPRGYRPIRVPRPHPGPLPPILPVHSWDTAQRGHQPPASEHRGPLSINGIAVSRIPPHHPEPDGAPARSSLRRDFPVDSTTHTPVFGHAGANPAPAHTPQQQPDNPQPPSAQRPDSPRSPSAQRPQPQPNGPSYPSTSPGRPAPTTHPDPSPWPGQRTGEPDNRPQHNEPPPTFPHPEHNGQTQQPHPEYPGPPQELHPEHAGPPQQPRPANEPPRQESHPNYSPAPRPENPRPTPPPSPPPAPRSPAPPPQPHPSK
jgi:hypothetical protein